MLKCLDVNRYVSTQIPYELTPDCFKFLIFFDDNVVCYFLVLRSHKQTSVTMDPYMRLKLIVPIAILFIGKVFEHLLAISFYLKSKFNSHHLFSP